MTANTRTRTGRLEGAIEVVILIAVAVMAGAASFSHVHDWTMDNAPAGTGSWFGWANAMVSELIPLAAGLEARRRKATYGKAGKYPVFLILAAVTLSLTGQFGEARPSVSGWIVSAVPALGFLALVKLILSRPTGTPGTDAQVLVTEPADHTAELDAPATDTGRHNSAHSDDTKPTRPAELDVTVPTELLPGARIIARSHHQATGNTISPDELARRMNLPDQTARQLLATIHPGSPATTVPATDRPHNGTPVQEALL